MVRAAERSVEGGRDAGRKERQKEVSHANSRRKTWVRVRDPGPNGQGVFGRGWLTETAWSGAPTAPGLAGLARPVRLGRSGVWGALVLGLRGQGEQC